MSHESDGAVKIAMILQCREYGHVWRSEMGEYKCPLCGCTEYDIKQEIYGGDDDGIMGRD